MDLYIDILILENFIVNLSLILITFKVLHIQYSFKKSVLVSLVGGLYAISMLTDIVWLKSEFMQIMMSFFMVYIPIDRKNIGKVARAMIVFLGVTFILSGICFKIIMYTQKYSIVNGVVIKEFEIKYLLLAIGIIFIFIERITTKIREKNIVTNFMYDLEMEISGEKIKIKAFLDSGNELREPITNLPCVIVEKNFLKDINFSNDSLYKIPYKSIGINSNLVGIKVEKIVVKSKGLIFREFKGIVCPCSEKLSRDSEFNALLSRGII